MIQWDDHPFLNMKPDPEVGPLALALRALLLEDLDPKQDRYMTHVQQPLSKLALPYPACSCSILFSSGPADSLIGQCGLAGNLQTSSEVGLLCAGASMLRCLMTSSPKGSECQWLYTRLSGRGQL